MLTFMKYDHVSSNAETLVAFVDRVKREQQGLRDAYFQSLNSIQDHKFRFIPQSNEVLLDFEMNDPSSRITLKHFMEQSTIDDTNLFSRDEAERIKENVSLSYPILNSYDPTVLKTISLVVGSFIFAKKAGIGASTNGDTLGVTWLNPPTSWKALDYAECILHESTHQALFLDEMVNSLFTSSPTEMLSDNGLITSAIRKTKRGYHLSFHSACVSAMIIDFYSRLGKNEKVNEFLGPLSITTEEMIAKHEFLTDYGKGILTEIDEIVRASK